ncbi:hypothetical protein KY321_04315 [Candidatus Woesearchaeota archaeon]|nr:hypothetical protein [Candidatus Woesearchaeota archaeon]
MSKLESFEKKKIEVILVLFLFVVLRIIILSEFNITGFSIYSEDVIDLNYNVNSVYLWQPQNSVKINDIALTGNISGNGNFKIFVISDEPHLLLDFNLNEQTVVFEEYSLEDNLSLDIEDKYFLRFEVESGEINLNKISYSESNLEDGSFQIAGAVPNPVNLTDPDIEWINPDFPDPILDLNSSKIGLTWIYWNWTKANNTDLNHTEVYLNGTFQANTTLNYYNATNLTDSTTYTINIRNVDDSGNVSEFYNHTSQTLTPNSAPIISELEFNPSNPNDVVDTVVIGRYDDLELQNGTIFAEFYINGTNVHNETKIVESGNYFNFTLARGNYSLNDNLSVIITANDTEDITQEQIQTFISLQGPVINSFEFLFNTTGLGITNQFIANITNGNSTIDSVWGNIINRKDNLSLSFVNLGNNWTASYKSYVIGSHEIEIYANDTNGVVEHQSKSYYVDADILLRIETEKQNYSFNEDVRIKELK